MPLKRYFKIFILFIVLFSGLFAFLFFEFQPSARPAKAAGDYHYVRTGAAGLNNGTDWANAWTSLPATLVRGDTYYIADGTYGGYTFNDAVSGELYITIKKAIESDHGTDTGWNASYGDGQAVFSAPGVNTGGPWYFTTSYWQIDGIVGDGFGEIPYGFKVALSQTFDNAIVVRIGSNADNISLSRVELDGINEGAVGAYQPRSDGLNIFSTGGNFNDNIKISNCYIHDCVRTYVLFGTVKNSVIENCYMEKMIGGNLSSGGYIHTGGIVNNTGAINGNNHIRNNRVRNTRGTNVIHFTNANASDYHIYGNVVWRTSAAYDITNGYIGSDSYSTVNNLNIYNNTIYNYDAGISAFYIFNGDNIIIKNNVLYNCGSNTFGSAIDDHDYNASNVDLSEVNSVLLATDPFINSATGDFRLNSPTQPGFSLSSPYNLDIIGNTRGLDGVWDRGAYEYVSASAPEPEPEPEPAPDTTPPSAPVGVSAN